MPERPPTMAYALLLGHSNICMSVYSAAYVRMSGVWTSRLAWFRCRESFAYCTWSLLLSRRPLRLFPFWYGICGRVLQVWQRRYFTRKRTQSVFRCIELRTRPIFIFSVCNIFLSVTVTILPGISLFAFSCPCSLAFHLYMLTAMPTGASTLSGSDGLRYAPIALEMYLHDSKTYLNTGRFAKNHPNEDGETIQDVHNGLQHDIMFCAYVRLWTPRGGLSAVLWSDNIC